MKKINFPVLGLDELREILLKAHRIYDVEWQLPAKDWIVLVWYDLDGKQWVVEFQFDDGYSDYIVQGLTNIVRQDICYNQFLELDKWARSMRVRDKLHPVSE